MSWRAGAIFVFACAMSVFTIEAFAELNPEERYGMYLAGVRLERKGTEPNSAKEKYYQNGFLQERDNSRISKATALFLYHRNGTLKEKVQGNVSVEYYSNGLTLEAANQKPLLSSADSAGNLILGLEESGGDKLEPTDPSTPSFNRRNYVEGPYQFLRPQRQGGALLSVVFDDGIISGPVTAWFESGAKRFEGFVKQGVLDGEYTRFTDGIGGSYVREKGSYIEGILNGLVVLYQAPEKKWFEINVTEGKFHGPLTVYHLSGAVSESCQFDNGLRVGQCKLYSSDGKLIVEGSYLAGLRNGEWNEWFENGQKKKEARYIQGKLEGEILTFAESGLVLKKETYKGNLLDGPAFHYDKNGKLKAMAEYKNNKRDGVVRVFYPNGKPEIETHFRSGVKNGTQKRFYESGELLEIAEFAKGKQVGFSQSYYKTGVKMGGAGALEQGSSNRIDSRARFDG